MRKIVAYSVIIVLTFIIAYFGKSVLHSYVHIELPTFFLKVAYSYIWWIVPTSLILGILYGFNDLLKNLGLNKGFLIGFIFSLITVFPMIISSAIAGTIDDNLNFGELFQKTFCAGFFEEFLFRGFLFGILFRKLQWGFIPASILGALIFGFSHIYQGSTPSETLGIFLVTAMGAVWFSWLYIEWNANLWVPIFLHSFMNLSWTLFDMSENALGGGFTNLFRVITIALTIIITIRYHKKTGLQITRKNLIVNSRK